MSGGSTKQATSVNTTTPWTEQIPYYKEGFKAADTLWKAPGPSYYPGNTVAPFSAEQTEAQGWGANRARSGNSVVNNAQGHANNVLNGNYLNSDPYQDSVFQNIRSHVQPAVASQFANSGRYGSGLHADTSTRALTEAYAPYASQQYQQGLDRMDNAAGMSPMFAQQDFANIEALNSIGAQKQQLGQREVDDAATRYAYYQDLPYNKLAQYMGLIGGSLGGTTTSQTPYYQPSTFSQIAGGLLGGLGTLGGLGIFG